MNRRQKIDYLRRLAAGRLAPGDLLRLLPKDFRMIINGPALGGNIYFVNGHQTDENKFSGEWNNYPDPEKKKTGINVGYL